MSENKQLVYVMKNSMSLHKIGISVDPARRCNDIRLASGLNTEIVNVFTTTNPAVAVEKALHIHFQSKRKEGEWFKLTKYDLQNIEKTVSQVDSEITNNISPVAMSAKELTTEELFNFLTSYKLSSDFTLKECENLWVCQKNFFRSLLSVSKEKYWGLIDLLDSKGYHVDYGIRTISDTRPFWDGVLFCYFVTESYPCVKVELKNKISALYKYESTNYLYKQYTEFCALHGIEAEPVN